MKLLVACLIAREVRQQLPYSGETRFSRVFPPLKLACTSFTGPPRRLNIFVHLNRLARASQHSDSGENCFLELSCHINSLVRASQDLPGG